jgi:hypothetical protein
MHASLSELLDNLQHGLLWVTREGVVRHANTQAGRRTGLSAGRRLFDPDLSKVVSEVVSMQTPKSVTAVGVAPQPGRAPAELPCRVIPGLARDDAFVLITGDVDSEAGIGFSNLMQVIRSDLRDPLRAAQTSLSLARNQRDGAAVDTLLDQVEGLTRTLDKLVDLASIWGSQSLMASDRIELWPLLQRVWSEVEPLAVERGVKARFQAQGDVASLATLYGSESWLSRVFQECLESAVRSTPKDGTLEIEHRQMGPRALIVFRDCGVFAPKAPGALAMGSGAKSPLDAAALPKRAAREEIGFHLCQHIVALHGGALREEEDDGIHNFLIDLPTGAPHHADNGQLDIAQAQQYARDLAALMARARHRKQNGAKPEGSAPAPTAGEAT